MNPMVRSVSSSEILKNSNFATCTLATIYRFALFRKKFKFTWVLQKEDNLKSLYSWNYCLSHTSERRMTKLHKSSSLESFDYDSFDKCGSSLLGKPLSKRVNMLMDY